MKHHSFTTQLRAFALAFMAGCEELANEARRIFTPVIFPAGPQVVL